MRRKSTLLLQPRAVGRGTATRNAATKIRDLVESGHATEGDQFVTFGWKPPKDEAVGN